MSAPPLPTSDRLDLIDDLGRLILQTKALTKEIEQRVKRLGALT